MGSIKSPPSSPSSKHTCKTNGDCNQGGSDPLHTAPQSKENYDWLVIIKVHKGSKGGRHCLFSCLHISSDTCHTAIWFFIVQEELLQLYVPTSRHTDEREFTIQFTTTYCALHRVTQVQQHLPGVLGWRRGRALHTHLQFGTGQTHRDRGNPHAPADHPDWQVDFRGLLTRKPHAGEVGFSTEATSVLTVRRQRQPPHPTPHGSRGRVQTGSPTSDGVFVGAEEPWQQQQVEEVDQRQDVVAEQAGCRHRETCGHMNQMTTLSWMPSWLSGTLVFNIFL